MGVLLPLIEPEVAEPPVKVIGDPRALLGEMAHEVAVAVGPQT